MNLKQQQVAKQAMIEWLAHPNELNKEPVKIECMKEFDLYDYHYYIFRFKTKLFGEWLLGVCGGYEKDSLEHCGHVYSDMKKYNDKSAIEDAIALVEMIRAYWIKRAQQQEDFQKKFKMNTEFRSQDEISAEEIEKQFVKSDNTYFLKVGEIDCPTGEIIVADPLAYLPNPQFSPILSKKIPVGRYPVEVSICRHEDISIRMCTAKLIVKQGKVVRYEKASMTEETKIRCKEGTLDGFGVDAGMMAFCDVQVAQEYRHFLDKWYQDHPNGNHYDDYFASFFAKSYQDLPAYQRKEGDFIEWMNPESQHKMVMIASGFGDSFYYCYYGYDDHQELCEIIVPMVNPFLFIS